MPRATDALAVRACVLCVHVCARGHPRTVHASAGSPGPARSGVLGNPGDDSDHVLRVRDSPTPRPSPGGGEGVAPQRGRAWGGTHDDGDCGMSARAPESPPRSRPASHAPRGPLLTWASGRQEDHGQ